jgi:hypothetical protein
VKISYSRPPNYDEILAAFPTAAKVGVVFTFGTIVYNPSRSALSPHIIAHEQLHSVQQISGADAWWRRYIDDRDFRLHEEILAYRVQWQSFLASKHNRHMKRGHFKHIVDVLSGPLYNFDISSAKAEKLILAETFP